MTLVLASRSEARQTMLRSAGLSFEAVPANVDEAAAKAGLLADGLDARALADALAELKAVRISRRRPADLVLGCDQVLALEDGGLLDKPESIEEAQDQLRMLRGQSHRLISAAVIALGGAPVWRHVEIAKLQMRDVSDAFLDDYLDQEWPAIAGCVGGYRLEALGVQLFSRIEGSYFTILGLPLLPLLPLLAYLRDRKELPA